MKRNPIKTGNREFPGKQTVASFINVEVFRMSSMNFDLTSRNFQEGRISGMLDAFKTMAYISNDEYQTIKKNLEAKLDARYTKHSSSD